MIKRIIWSTDIDTSEEAIKDYRDNVLDEDDAAGLDDDAVIQRMYEDNDDVLSDERDNLDIAIDNPILVIADLGLWNGRKQGYRILNEKNVNAIFGVTCGDYVTFYTDAYNVRCDDAHHDGTNRYLFRELRGTEEECAVLIDAVYNGKEITSALLNRYSRSLLPHVAKVYGWPCASLKRAENKMSN